MGDAGVVGIGRDAKNSAAAHVDPFQFSPAMGVQIFIPGEHLVVGAQRGSSSLREASDQAAVGLAWIRRLARTRAGRSRVPAPA
jgi:hypothetical protein